VTHCAPLVEEPGGDREDQRTGARDQDEQDQQQPEHGLAESAQGLQAARQGRAAWPAGGQRHRTIEPSNHVLIVASCGPQVYGLMDWVLTLASEGSDGSGLVPVRTG
jgi:hypothetical protein